LDNFEHLADAAPTVGELLGTSPGLKVLATSRMPLRLRAEREYPVPSLALPNRHPPPPVAQLTQYEAVRLFIERAQAVTPTFTVDNQNAPAVAEICWRLDGLPLAIELAAARVRMLPPQAMLARLEKRLPLLTGGARDLPERQRTLRETIRWSHDLLTEEEQILFRRLAVFAGGATLDATDAVANPAGEFDVFVGLERLVEQNLVRQEAGLTGEPRFTMLETIREFGVEQLAASQEMDEVRQLHARYMLRLTADQAQAMQILQHRETVVQVTTEYENIRLALTWFEERGEIAALLQLSVALYGFWIARGLLDEGLRWLERALERSRDTPTSWRVQALNGAANLALFQGNNVRAETFITESLAAARVLGEPFLLGQTLANAGLVSYRRGDFAQAEHLLTEAHQLLRERSGSTWVASPPLLLGDTALAQGHFDQAAAHYTETLRVLEGTSYDWVLSDAQAGLGAVSYCTGNLKQAAGRYHQTLERAREVDLPLLLVSALLGVAGVAAEVGQLEAGARLLGAAEALTTSLGSTIFRRDYPVRDRGLAALRAALGEERLAAEREAGRTLSLQAAITEAQAVAEAVKASP
jgi:predicted ATPase